MKNKIGIEDKDQKKVAQILNIVLSSEFALYIKTRQFHWNVEGMNFISLHKLFEEQYEFLDEKVDEIAERVRALGEYSFGSMKQFLAHTVIKENDKVEMSDKNMLTQLLADHEALIRFIRENLEKIEAAGDQGTEDFLVGLMEEHEKVAWMLRASLS